MDLKIKGQYDLGIVRPMAHSNITQVAEIERKITFHPLSLNTFSVSLKPGYKYWIIDSDDPVNALATEQRMHSLWNGF